MSDTTNLLNAKNSKPKKDILVVEDALPLQQIYHQQITRLGYSFNVVDCGKAALLAVANTQYRLILLDFGLPDMTGVLVARHLRQNASLEHMHVPIVMLSASGDLVQAECLDAGANQFFIKTIIPTQAFKYIIAYFLEFDCAGD